MIGNLQMERAINKRDKERDIKRDRKGAKRDKEMKIKRDIRSKRDKEICRNREINFVNMIMQI